MNLNEQIKKELTEAMKSKDTIKVTTLRFLRSEMHNREINTRRELEDSEVIEVITSLIKKNKESIEQFKRGEREDLVLKETREMKILESFLPPPLSEEEVKGIIKEAVRELGATSLKEMGKVMAKVIPQVKGRFDGKKVNVLVKEVLDNPQQ